MKKPSQEGLLGYMLGALDAQEHEQVQKAIDQDSNLEERLLSIKATLAPLEMIDKPCGPPAGLARRTCQVIAAARREMGIRDLGSVRESGACEFHTPDLCTENRQTKDENGSVSAGLERLGPTQVNQRLWTSEIVNEVPVSAVLVSPTAVVGAGQTTPQSDKQDTLNFRTTVSARDFWVGITACLVIGALLFPALIQTRFQNRITNCQSNLTQVYYALAQYAENNHGNFVEIQSKGPLAVAGAFAPILKQSGLIQDDRIFACPGLGSESKACHIPSCEQIRSADCPKSLHALRVKMSGDYGYTLGYFDGNRYAVPSENGNAFVVIVADSPFCGNPRRLTKNHSGRGANSAFADGSIKFLPNGQFGTDNIYENDLGNIGPGLHSEDSVVAASFVPWHASFLAPTEAFPQ